MRVLFWHENELEPGAAGGAESMLRDLTRALKELGHEVAWLHSEHIRQAVDTFKPDVVQVWTLNNRMPLSVVDYLRDAHIPHVWALMNYWPFCSENTMLKNMDESCNAVNRVCDGNCQSHRANHVETVNRSPVLALNDYSAEIFQRNGVRCDYVAELGVDTELFKPDETLRDEGSIYTSSAWVHYPHKGMKYVQEAIAGTDYRVKVMSGLTRDKIAIGLKHADIFLFPSTYEETWGLCLTEAMASGCACIASDVAGARAQIHPGMGLKVPPRDALELRAAIKSLVENKEMRGFFGKNAREHVEKEHTLEAMGKRYLEVYEDVIKRN